MNISTSNLIQWCVIINNCDLVLIGRGLVITETRVQSSTETRVWCLVSHIIASHKADKVTGPESHLAPARPGKRRWKEISREKMHWKLNIYKASFRSFKGSKIHSRPYFGDVSTSAWVDAESGQSQTVMMTVIWVMLWHSALSPCLARTDGSDHPQ